MTRARLAQYVAVALLLSALSGFSVQADDAASDPFPDIESIRPHVEFWTRVFAEWQLSQVAIHDQVHPQLVYEVVELPGPVGDRYTDQQKDFVEDIRESWEHYLKALAKKVAHDKPLDDIESQWKAYILDMLGPDGLKGAHDRVRSQRGLRERFLAGLERSHRYDSRMREIFRDAGLPEDLAYLPHVESSFQAHARSSAGASGMWQFTRSTGRLYLHINSAIDERLDPILATYGAAAYLRDAIEKLDTWPLALTSYNHGVNGMARAKEKFGTDFGRIVHEYKGRYFGFASRNFYAEFLAARDIAREHERYFPGGYTPQSALDHDETLTDHRTTPGLIAKKYRLTVKELAAINPAWTSRAVRSPLKLPTGTRVWLPAGTLERVAEAGGTVPIGEPNGWIDTDGYYVVERGDTLSSIAKAFDASVVDLRRLNGISSRNNLIRVGQRLRLPDEEREHVVRRGETLSRIASRYGVRLADLLAANTLTMRSVIHPGQVLRIP